MMTGLSERAGHDERFLMPIHGSLLDLECSSEQCDFAIHDPFSSSVIHDFIFTDDTNIGDPRVDLPQTEISQLPYCPKCGTLMRPAIVLFYERLYEATSQRIDEWFEAGTVDLLLIVGTSALVSPAAEFIDLAIEKGARLAVVDSGPPERSNIDLQFGCDHWYFQGDAANVLPEILKTVIGEA